MGGSNPNIEATHVPSGEEKYIGTLYPDPKDPTWWYDNHLKGTGYLGMMARRDQPYSQSQKPVSVSGEISSGATRQEMGNPNAKISSEGYVDFPQMVPTLNKNELDYLLDTPMKDLERNNPDLSERIRQKSIDFAKQRQSQGKGYFATPEESQIASPRFMARPQLNN
jgi:hypothetical protein